MAIRLGRRWRYGRWRPLLRRLKTLGKTPPKPLPEADRVAIQGFAERVREQVSVLSRTQKLLTRDLIRQYRLSLLFTSVNEVFVPLRSLENLHGETVNTALANLGRLERAMDSINEIPRLQGMLRGEVARTTTELSSMRPPEELTDERVAEMVRREKKRLHGREQELHRGIESLAGMEERLQALTEEARTLQRELAG